MDADAVVVEAGLNPRTRLHYAIPAIRSNIAQFGITADLAESWLVAGGFDTAGTSSVEEARPCRIWAAPATADAAIDDVDRSRVALALAAELQRVLGVHGVTIQLCERVDDFGAADLAIWGAEDHVPQAVTGPGERMAAGDGFLQVVDAGASPPTTPTGPTEVDTTASPPTTPTAPTEQAKLTAADAVAKDRFGWSVAISGDTAIVGAPDDDDTGNLSGSAYLFARDSGGAGAWGQVAKLTAADAAAVDRFGVGVAISGDTVIVGARGDNDAGDRSGSAYLFERDLGGAEAWGQVAKLTAADAAADDRFGRSVAISGDTVIVGAIHDDDAGDDSGSAYLFARDQGGAGAWGQVAKLTAADAAAGDGFGSSVAISGDTVIVGASGDDDAGERSGSAYLFARDQEGAEAWGQVAKLTAADGASGDGFGVSVAISGGTVIVGALFDDHAGAESGSAYLFARDQGGAGAWGQVAKLTAAAAAAAAAFAAFGESVAISGDTVIVGAAGDDDAGTSSGSAYLFARDQGGAGAWGQVAKLTAAAAARGDQFGASVAISGDTVSVGAFGDDDASGSAYVFHLVLADTTVTPTAPEAPAVPEAPTGEPAGAEAPAALPSTGSGGLAHDDNADRLSPLAAVGVAAAAAVVLATAARTAAMRRD